MAESQNGVTTDAITALIAAILALANALDKKRRAFIRRISRCAFEHVSTNAARRCQRGCRSHIRWHADSARTRDKESPETNVIASLKSAPGHERTSRRSRARSA